MGGGCTDGIEARGSAHGTKGSMREPVKGGWWSAFCCWLKRKTVHPARLPVGMTTAAVSTINKQLELNVEAEPPRS